ncbi:MAG: DUF4231 domain-containing protein [Pseudanabaena sp. ELA607]|jgi:hypothetical protein
MADPSPSQSTELNQKLLENAWELFDIYSDTASKTKKRFLNFRITLLVMGVVSTALVVVLSAWDHPNLQSAVKFASGNKAETIAGIKNIFYTLAVIAPIAVSVLLAASVKLDRGMNWILLRASAEKLKKEIYLYRVDSFYDNRNNADNSLAKKIEEVSDRLMKTEVNRSGLVIESNKSKIALQTKVRFSSLTADQYLKYRLIDQLSWYRSQTVKLDRQWQLLQWSIYVLGGLGTFWAAMQEQIWIAITNAIATAITSYLDFKQLDSTLVCYNQAAFNLENVLCWWYALTDKDRADPKSIKKLVKSTEDVIQAETSSWVAEMSEAVSKLYEENKDPQDKPSNESN